MTLLEFLPKSNAEGGIIQWLKCKHVQSGAVSYVSRLWGSMASERAYACPLTTLMIH